MQEPFAPDGGYIPRILFAEPNGTLRPDLKNPASGKEYAYFYDTMDKVSACFLRCWAATACSGVLQQQQQPVLQLPDAYTHFRIPLPSYRLWPPGMTSCLAINTLWQIYYLGRAFAFTQHAHTASHSEVAVWTASIHRQAVSMHACMSLAEPITTAQVRAGMKKALKTLGTGAKAESSEQPAAASAPKMPDVSEL